MTLPLPKELGTPKLESDSHLGLWWQRFADLYGENCAELQDPDAKKTKRKDFLAGVSQDPAGNSSAVKRKALGLAKLAEALGGKFRVAKVRWRFVTGLGLPHPLENGFAWHPTLGTPYLPGSSVKGLVRAWLETEVSDGAALARSWCGELEQAGSLIFFDALPMGRTKLEVDILTPHMDKWYEQGGQLQDPSREPEKVPGDWHEPVPTAFLTVGQASFLFAVAPRPGAPKCALEPRDVLDNYLLPALGTLGAGAKTAAGYGRMEKDDSGYMDLRKHLGQERTAPTLGRSGKSHGSR